MSGVPVKLGPFINGLHNSAGTGEYIADNELFELTNLEVDTDGSLANRPAISTLDWASTLGDGKKVLLGTYSLVAGKEYLVVSYEKGTDYKVSLIDLSSGASVSEQGGFSSYCACGIQYDNKYYVYPEPGTSDQGGYFDEENWTSVDLPGGQAANCVIYKERLFSVAGLGSISNSSRMYFSDIADPTSFSGTDYFDLNPGNGERITDILVLNSDLVVFKEHTTYRAGYSSDIAKMVIIPVNTTVGSSRSHCSTVYDNSAYILHGSNVYEMYNYQFTNISSNLRMDSTENEQLESDTYGISVYKDRVFVRYYDRLYVYNALSRLWCEWQTSKKFRFLVIFQKPSGDIAYGASVSTGTSKEVYSIRDSRIEDIKNEDFICRVITKTYDFELSYTYKVMFWWGMTIATLGNSTARVVSPNAGRGYTWQGLAQYTWQGLLDQNIKWSSANPVIRESTVPAEIGTYSRKFIKLPGKTRFRQAYFEVTSNAKPNIVGDAAVRIYDISVFLKPKETVVKRTTA